MVCSSSPRHRAVINSFDIVVVRTATAATVRVCGELDADTAPGLRDRLASLVEEGITDITVDLAELGFIDSSGLSSLVVGLKRVREHGGDLVMLSPTPSTMRVFEITGLTSLFTLA